MGEIKSTLDLVMEKTRHLSLSAEEKNRQKRADYRKRLQGLLQRYEDGGDSVSSVKDRIAALEAELDFSDRKAVIDAVAERIDPDQNNERRLALLKELAPGMVDPLSEVLAAHRQKRASVRRNAEKRLKADLFRHHGIGGSAVVPNQQMDPGYPEAMASLRKESLAAVDAISKNQEPG